MKKIDINQKFVEELYAHIPDKRRLTSVITETLNLDRQTALRRLNEKILFTAQEMGVLGTKLGISLDRLLYNNEDQNFLPFRVVISQKVTSIDHLLDEIEERLKIHKERMPEPELISTVYETLPLIFFVHYPALCKFMYYKWNYYFVDSTELHSFSSWTMPERLINYLDEIKDIYSRCKHSSHIWNISALWNLAKEITFFFNIRAISQSELEDIKNELYDMMYTLEEAAGGGFSSYFRSDNTDLYISNINTGMYYSYCSSGDQCYCLFRNEFIRSIICEDNPTCIEMANLINSLKMVSTDFG